MSDPSLIPGFVPTISEDSPYHYIPSKSIAILFLALYGVSTLIHAVQLTRYRMWWLLPTVCLCGVLELLGWSGRLWSHFSPFLDTPFQIQITCTIIAPTPLLAANFVIFGEMIKGLGTSFSRLGSKWYTIIFCTCDVVSLVVQGIGGGLAATADTHAGAIQGANIMLGGIVFQVVVIVVFSFCAAEFLCRYHRDLPFPSSRPLGEKNSEFEKRGFTTTNVKVMLAGLAFSTLVLFIRAIYRTIELAGGWNGPIIRNERLFSVLDGAMVVLAIYTLNFIHPGHFLANDAPKSSNSSDLSPNDA